MTAAIEVRDAPAIRAGLGLIVFLGAAAAIFYGLATWLKQLFPSQTPNCSLVKTPTA
jgi:hypothetical protein